MEVTGAAKLQRFPATRPVIPRAGRSAFKAAGVRAAGLTPAGAERPAR